MDFLSASNNARNTFAASRSPAKAPRRSPVLRSSPDEGEDLVASSPSDGRRLSSARGDPTPLTNRSVNAGVTNKNAARQNGKARLVATEPADFSDGEGEGDENVDSFAAGRDDFSDGYDEGDETVMPEEPADGSVQDLHGQEDEASPAPAASRQTKTTATSAKQPNKGPAAKTTKAAKPAAKPTGKRGRAPKSQQAADNEEPVEARPAKKPRTTATTSQAPREPLDPELERMVENYAQRTGPLKGRSLYILKREDPTSSETTHTRSGRVSVRPLAYWRNERCVYGDEEAAEGERFPLSKIKEVIRTEELEPEKPKKGKRSRKGKKKQRDESEDEDEIDDDADLWEKETGVLHGYISKWDPVAQTSTAEEEVIGMYLIPRLALGFPVVANAFLQTSRTRHLASRQGKSKARHSNSQNCSVLHSSAPVSLSCRRMVSRSPRIQRECTWYSMSAMAESKSISAVSNSAPARDPCSRFHEVSLLHDHINYYPPTDTSILLAGNYYSFQNSHDKDARLFFTQCCLPEGSEVPVQTENAVQSEFEAESGPSEPPAAKPRGRPKGKQKAK